MTFVKAIWQLKLVLGSPTSDLKLAVDRYNVHVYMICGKAVYQLNILGFTMSKLKVAVNK